MRAERSGWSHQGQSDVSPRGKQHPTSGAARECRKTSRQGSASPVPALAAPVRPFRESAGDRGRRRRTAPFVEGQRRSGGERSSGSRKFAPQLSHDWGSRFTSRRSGDELRSDARPTQPPDDDRLPRAQRHQGALLRSAQNAWIACTAPSDPTSRSAPSPPPSSAPRHSAQPVHETQLEVPPFRRDHYSRARRASDSRQLHTHKTKAVQRWLARASAT